MLQKKKTFLKKGYKCSLIFPARSLVYVYCLYKSFCTFVINTFTTMKISIILFVNNGQVTAPALSTQSHNTINLVLVAAWHQLNADCQQK